MTSLLFHLVDGQLVFQGGELVYFGPITRATIHQHNVGDRRLVVDLTWRALHREKDIWIREGSYQAIIPMRRVITTRPYLTIEISNGALYQACPSGRPRLVVVAERSGIVTAVNNVR
jgi:hypothetical protein